MRAPAIRVMPSAHPDAFESFAAHARLQFEVEPILAAPRDVLTPLADVEQHYLVTLKGPGSEKPLRLTFITPTAQESPPGTRDVLWWLAADAWAVERSSGKVEAWAATYGYPPNDETTRRLYSAHVAYARALSDMLVGADYQSLLSIYESEVSQSARK
jgi:hypothetical protein